MGTGEAARQVDIHDLPADVAVLAGRLPRARLEEAVQAAGRAGCEPHEILLGKGLIGAEAYYAALAGSVGARFAPFVRLWFPADPFVGRPPAEAARLGMMIVAGGRGNEIATAPRGRQVAAFVSAMREHPGAGRRILVTTPQALTDAVAACGGNQMMADALSGLGRLPANLSARTVLGRAQSAVFLVSLTIVLAAALARPQAALLALTLVLAAFFLAVSGLRLLAAALAVARLRQPDPARPAPQVPDAGLPIYTVLVPLRGEANMVGPLVGALSAIDYPAHRLDIKFVVEADDPATLAALRRRDLPPQFEVIAVPEGGPKTKPKALCFALGLARGSLLTVYDAEDRPEPDQLRLAAARLAAAPPEVACLQARLAWRNWQESWFSRQLAIEYAGLFGALLPALARLGLPLPLGGTSNHFRGIR